MKLVLSLLAVKAWAGYNVGGYIGCYRDESDRDLNGHVEKGYITPYTCMEICARNKFGYAGLQATDECWCGNTYGRYSWNNHNAHCNLDCKSHNYYTCGGHWANSVYEVNECGYSTHSCHSLATCTNTHGSYTCACNSGYETTPGYTTGQQCRDIDECSNPHLNTCHDTRATCVNSSGSYSCTCKSGYRDQYGHSAYAGSNYKDNRGRTCYDINECDTASSWYHSGTNNCHADADCSNAVGTYSCACKTGFNDNGYGTYCSDIDECNGENRCDDVATCENTHGDHQCTCPTGYTDSNGDGSVCDDIDECAENPCHGDAGCTNTIGSYHCDCNEDHQGEGHECTLCHAESTWSTEGEDVTHMNAVCRCNTGYHGDGDLCEDIDECDDGTHLCDPNATCTNTIASHYCTCNVGFYGFGQTCTACDPETHLSEMTFECDTDTIRVIIPYCAFYNDDITNHSFMGTGENCTNENTGINMEMSIPTTSECGTTVTNNGTYLVYSNAIVGDVREHDGVASRKKLIDLDFECGFEADVDLSSDNIIHAMIDHVEIQLERHDQEFDIQMGVFTDDTFTELVHDDYSIVVPDIIHAAVQLMDGEDALVLLAEKCWATPSSDPEDETQYVFLDNFCSTIDTDGIFNIGRNGIDREAQFELESFEFDGYADGIIYLHCHANVCDTELEDCTVDCTESGRRRRSNTRNRRSIGETSSPLRVGPIRVIDPSH